MWDIFLLTIIAGIIILYLPGFIFLKALRFSSQMSLVISPVIAITAYSCMGILFEKLSIFCSWQSMFLPLLLVCLLILFLSKLFSFARKKDAHLCSIIAPRGRTDWLIIGAYLAVGCLIAAFYFILPLNGANSFNQGPDNAFHLSLIQSFLDSGNFSSLNASYYQTIENVYQDPTGAGGSAGFYPAAWHCFTALAGSATSAGAAIAANASLFIFLAIVFPLNIYGLISILFAGNRLAIISGALVAIAFGAFPWNLLTFGPLYPNFVAFVMVPTFVGLFISVFKKGIARHERVVCCILFVLGLPGLVLLQTNAVFTVGVFLIPFCVGLIWKTANLIPLHSFSKRVVRVLLIAAFIVMCGVLWFLFYNLPVMQGVVSYPWEPFTSLRQEVANIFFLSYRETPAQPILGILVVIGALYLLKQKRNRWLVVTYIICCFMCMTAAIMSGELRSVLIGFWYTDSYRIAAMAALAGIPLATLGLYCLFRVVVFLWDKLAGFDLKENKLVVTQIVSISLVMLVFFYYPNFNIIGIGQVQTALGEFESEWFDYNNNIGACVLDHDEQEFLKEVRAVVGDDLVINKPDDGSVFAYGSMGIDVFYKRTGIEGYYTDSEESQLFRNCLDEYIYNNKVQDAVERVGAKYLLLLDLDVNDTTQERYWYDHYYEDRWQGIDSISDDTPGFRIVLSEGDMRLYEIEPIE